MFERLQKPFLTVETGEAYQPIRLDYQIYQKDKLIEKLNALGCCEQNLSVNGWNWNWFWKAECEDLRFESLDTYKKNPDYPLRLGSLKILEDHLFINLPSFKRACLAVPFFHQMIKPNISKVIKADFINKVFATDERLPHGFTELFKENELEKILHQRMEDYEKVQANVESASTPEEAFNILSNFANTETKKRLPFAERYAFRYADTDDSDVIFLSFYIFLHARELVAIRRWLGETGITLSDLVDEAMEQVFGSMDIDIIE